MARSTTAFLVPLKSFRAAKGRLGAELGEAERGELMRSLAAGVLAAAGGFDRFVVCDEAAVCRFALVHGAQVIWRGGGLNPAVQTAVEQLGREGYTRVITSHGDLAQPGGFEAFDGGNQRVLIGSDRHGDGSNVLSVPTGSGFRFGYGPGSLQRHIDEANRCGLAVAEVSERSLQLDVDTLEDLGLYRESLTLAEPTEGRP